MSAPVSVIILPSAVTVGRELARGAEGVVCEATYAGQAVCVKVRVAPLPFGILLWGFGGGVVVGVFLCKSLLIFACWWGRSGRRAARWCGARLASPILWVPVNNQFRARACVSVKL